MLQKGLLNSDISDVECWRFSLYLTEFLLAENRNGGVGSAEANGVLSPHSEAVGLSFFQACDMAFRDTDGLPLVPLFLSLFLILHQEACDCTSSIAIRPVPDQPHFSLVHIFVVQVFGRTRWDWWDRRKEFQHSLQRHYHLWSQRRLIHNSCCHVSTTISTCV